MSFTRRFLHDVFISYASDNNAAPDDEHEGLITAFHQKLTEQLRALGVKDGLDIFFDVGDVGDAQPLPDQILSAARASGVFIAIHSPAYDASTEWCHREFYEFSEANPDWERRLFLISLNKDSPPDRGQVFRGQSRRFRPFFEEKAERWFTFSTLRPGATNPPPRGLSFHEEVEDLARELEPILRRLRDEAPVKKVFLTSASDAWKRQAKDVKDDLTGLGYQVLQTSPWIGIEQRKADAERFIELAEIVVGIEESFRSAGQTEAGEHTAEQLDIARRLNKPQLRWLPGDDKHGFAPEEIVALKARGEVLAGSLQEFKKLIVQRLKAPAPTAVVIPPGPDIDPADPAALVLLICAREDEEKAFADLVTTVSTLAVGYDGYVDPTSAVESDAVKAWCDSVKDRVSLFEPTAVMFLDGRCSRDWIDDRLRRYFVLQRDLPKRPPAAVCECEPIPKESLRRFRPAGRVQIFRQNDAAALRAFLHR